MSLKQRKKIVDLELENCSPLDTETLKELLKCDNTNEKLIVKYIYSLPRDEAIYELMEYSYCISVNRIIEIESKNSKIIILEIGKFPIYFIILYIMH